MPPRADFRAVRDRARAACADETVVDAAILRLLRATAGPWIDPDSLRRATARALADELRARGLPADEAALYLATGPFPAVESPVAALWALGLRRAVAPNR